VPQAAATLGVSIPTDTPSAGTPPVPGGTVFHQPPARLFSGQRPYKFGLVAGMEDPFFATLLKGARQSAANLDIELFAQLPQNWNSAEQIQILEALLARGDLDALLISPVDPQALLPSLQKAAEAGVLIITIQTSLAENPTVIPLTVINTDNHLGGYLACQALLDELTARDEASATTPTVKTPTLPKKIYIQKGEPGILDPEAREQGCKDALPQDTDVQLAGTDANAGDPVKASQQVLAILQRSPDLSAIVCTDIICTQAASQALISQGLSGKIIIVALDATPAAVELLRQGSIDILLTPKPADMGYLAVALAAAALDGVTSLPPSFSIGWAIITRQNLDDPATARWLYDSNTGSTLTGDLQRSTAGLKIAFVAGIDDPFYYTMQRGAELAATSLGAILFSQFPQNWSAAEQAQIIDTMYASGELDALLLVPTDPLALIPSLLKIAEAGVLILALDTSLDPAFTPLSALSSDNQQGGYFACRSLANAINGRGKLYIQNVTPSIPATDARQRGCQMALGEFPEITLIAVNYNEDDPAKAQAQLSTILLNYPDLSGVFCTNVLGAQAVGQYLGSQGLSGKVIVTAFDATAGTIDLLRNGVIDMVVAQKPADMGYLAVLFAVAGLNGVTDLPVNISTGFVLLTRQNMDDPAYARYFYTK